MAIVLRLHGTNSDVRHARTGWRRLTVAGRHRRRPLIEPNGGSTVLYFGNLLPTRSEQNVAVEAQDPMGRHDLEQDHGWPVWGAAIREALERRGITINSAASQLGMRNTTLKRWLSGEVPPQLSRLASFAELTGVSQAVQLELGNVLPQELCAEAHAMQVADQLRNALGEIEGAVSRASEPPSPTRVPGWPVSSSPAARSLFSSR